MVNTYRVYAINGEYINRIEAADEVEALRRARIIGGVTVVLEG